MGAGHYRVGPQGAGDGVFDADVGFVQLIVILKHWNETA